VPAGAARLRGPLADSYSYLKALRHPDVLDGIRENRPTRLPHVEIILADLCQQACNFCAYRLPGYTSNQLFDEKRMMPLYKAIEILEDCAAIGVEAVQFTGGGEPTIYPHFALVLEKTIALGLKFSLVSNGVRITPELAELIAKASWVRISLDSATEENYVSIRHVHRSHWVKAQNAVRLLKAAGCPVLGVGFVITPENWQDVYNAAKLASDLGADNFRISAMFSQQDEKLFTLFHAEAAELCRQAASLSTPSFTVYNRFADRIEDLTKKNPEDQLCGYQFFTTYIGADLNVYRCCGYAYNERGLMGSLKEQSFRDFWLAQARFDEQKAFDARGCERCQFRKINSALAYVLDPNPRLHEEFV
jgi:radical SAM protein with 4Fe4S-binding SPASM domain